MGCEQNLAALHVMLIVRATSKHAPLTFAAAMTLISISSDTLTRFTLPAVHRVQEQLVAACSGRWPDKVSSTGPKRYGKDAAHWVRADESCSLQQTLKAPGHVIPGLPLLWVVARGTIYRDRFLSEELTR